MRNNSVKLFGSVVSCLKEFLSGALVALLFSGAESFMQFKRGHHGEHSCEVI